MRGDPPVSCSLPTASNSYLADPADGNTDPAGSGPFHAGRLLDGNQAVGRQAAREAWAVGNDGGAGPTWGQQHFLSTRPLGTDARSHPSRLRYHQQQLQPSYADESSRWLPSGRGVTWVGAAAA